jgi:hypothetical protein
MPGELDVALPMTVAIDNRGDPRTATASAARAGLTVVGTEMAGAGTVSNDALAVCRRGVHNVLAHLGVLPPEMADPPKTASPVYELPGPNAYVLATAEGVFRAVPCQRNRGARRSAGRAGSLPRRSKPLAGRTRLPDRRPPLRAAAAGQSEAGELLSCRRSSSRRGVMHRRAAISFGLTTAPQNFIPPQGSLGEQSATQRWAHER